jgi:SAM-dependent methyltransferase
MDIADPAFDYDREKVGYAVRRQTDPRIARHIQAALGDARTVLNVGAGTGSYEPTDRYVVSIEPSAEMRAQRAGLGRHPAVSARADRLPFDEGAFDAAMALLTVHHWPDLETGLAEVRRVTLGPVVVMTYDGDQLDVFWNARYFPEVIEVERRRYPKLDRLAAALGGNVEIRTVPIPLDCVDGFQEAFYGRPEAFLDPEVRRAQSAWGFVDQPTQQRLIASLEADLQSGRWDELYGKHRTMPEFHGALRLVIGRP